MNTQNYVAYKENPPGGSNTDFYAGRDEQFVRHRNKLAGQVEDIRQAVEKTPESELLFVKVALQSRALAKSHRPIQKVFNLRKSEYVGGEELGSMIVELPVSELRGVTKTIAKAEDETNWEIKGNKRKAKPSRERSEVGAISSINRYSAADRRKFSIELALEWLSKPGTGGAYFIEFMFDEHSIGLEEESRIHQLERSALKKFKEDLSSLELPIDFKEIEFEVFGAPITIAHIHPDEVENFKVHERLISFLERSEIVRSILLPPILQSEFTAEVSDQSQDIAAPGVGEYPILGIIDTGIASLASLDAWKVGSSEFIDSEHQDFSHGTFIAGLVANGEGFNRYNQLHEAKCKFFDLGLHPTEEEKYQDYYPSGFMGFLSQLDYEIAEAKKSGARIFNMSLSVQEPVADDSYGIFASAIDKLSSKHDVIIVLPAGNLSGDLVREKWPDDKAKVMELLANYKYQGRDRIYQPADSVSSVVVGALDAPGADGSVRPAQYTRRGPGPGLGSKPDVCHIGGTYHADSGLVSIDTDGMCVEACGTSYAAPLVAKTLAVMNHSIEGDVLTETLKALMVHNAKIPSCLTDDDLNSIRKEFVGVGLPASSEECLNVEDYEITLIFNGVITDHNALDFQFSWPESLVNENGGCKGEVSVSMVYTPPLDKKFGSEFVRVNMDVYLRQEKIDKNTGEVKFVGGISAEEHKNYERELIAHGLKWWPIKFKSGRFLRKGSSSQWKLVVEPLVRANQLFPEAGIPFSVVMTIRDFDEAAPIFTEMRTQLQQQGVEIADVKIALTTRVRQ